MGINFRINFDSVMIFFSFFFFSSLFLYFCKRFWKKYIKILMEEGGCHNCPLKISFTKKLMLWCNLIWKCIKFTNLQNIKTTIVVCRIKFCEMHFRSIDSIKQKALKGTFDNKWLFLSIKEGTFWMHYSLEKPRFALEKRLLNWRGSFFRL